MAKSKWKDDAIAKELIERLSECQSNINSVVRRLHQDYESSFCGLRFETYINLLKENIRFGDIPDSVRDKAINTAVFKSADEGKLNSGYVSNILKEEENNYLSIPKKDYFLVTGVSVHGLKSNLKVRTSSAEITILKGFPKKFKDSYSFKCIKDMYPKINLKSFSWVTIKVSARCIHSAANLALEELGYFLGVINHYLIPGGRRRSFGVADPISKVRKFPLHYLFNPDGTLATDVSWYEPNFSLKGTTYTYDEKFKSACSHFRSLHKSILRTKRHKFFKVVFSRLNDALETNDMQKVFLTLWALLEKITFTQKDNYSITIDRALIIFKDKIIAKKELDLLRQKRNLAIHSGEQFQQSERYAYMLYGYIRHYIFFIVDVMLKINDDEDIKAMLDLPTTKVKIKEYERELNKKIEQTEVLKKLIELN
ncbi:hypothetical protein [Salinivibrio kushneri]|uniref:hypothetical protein n=1 Tax=Salinivibrio kushneri TaxID=1908198 RepID=UPI000988D8FD|nr:hypothetical protein [Salinivibrio kushneri]OOE71053.1 hypothetical protein BZG19_03570 [Salinivibrio kushneri]